MSTCARVGCPYNTPCPDHDDTGDDRGPLRPPSPRRKRPLSSAPQFKTAREVLGDERADEFVRKRRQKKEAADRRAAAGGAGWVEAMRQQQRVERALLLAAAWDKQADSLGASLSELMLRDAARQLRTALAEGDQ